MLMPRIVRMRKMPGNGTSGAFVVRSMATNEISRTAAIANRTSVSAEPQPA